MGRLIIDGNSVYEIDEACEKRQEQRGRQDHKQEPPRPRGEDRRRRRQW